MQYSQFNKNLNNNKTTHTHDNKTMYNSVRASPLVYSQEKCFYPFTVELKSKHDKFSFI